MACSAGLRRGSLGAEPSMSSLPGSPRAAEALQTALGDDHQVAVNRGSLLKDRGGPTRPLRTRPAPCSAIPCPCCRRRRCLCC